MDRTWNFILVAIAMTCLHGLVAAAQAEIDAQFRETVDQIPWSEQAGSSSLLDQALFGANVCYTCGDSTCAGCNVGETGKGYFGGVDFLLVRPHFSEAVAFASGAQTPTSYQTQGEALGFQFAGALKAPPPPNPLGPIQMWMPP